MGDRHEYWKKRWEKEKSSSDRRDRHEYWAERWAKQKMESENKKPIEGEKKKLKKKDRHRKGYYHDYNKAHPERLERGFTKGYKNGCVSDGLKEKTPNYDGGCIEVIGDGYYIDRMGWKRHIDPITDALTIKEQQWHDDDWEESCIDD